MRGSNSKSLFSFLRKKEIESKEDKTLLKDALSYIYNMDADWEIPAGTEDMKLRITANFSQARNIEDSQKIAEFAEQILDDYSQKHYQTNFSNADHYQREDIIEDIAIKSAGRFDEAADDYSFLVK